MFGGEIEEILAIGREVASILVDPTAEPLTLFDPVAAQPPTQQQDGARRSAPEHDNRPPVTSNDAMEGAGSHILLSLRG